jgi:hypothetical protein
MRESVVLASIAIAAMACSGTSFTSVPDDASAGDALADSGAPQDAGKGDAVSDAPSDAGLIACSEGGPACPTGMICSSCQQGICIAKPQTAAGDPLPACGCDNKTYFNVTTAYVNGMSVRSPLNPSACSGAATCTTLVGCSNGASCLLDVSGTSACATASGVCVILPPSCPSAASTKFRQCNATTSSCTTACDLTKSNVAYYKDANCP